MIISTAEPFLFPGNRTGCLLVHGFTGAPKEMRWMGEYLANLGYSVLGVRLAGHATQPMDMQAVKWQDWLASVEDGYFILKGMADRVIVIGLSMGGILSLHFAAHHPITGIVAMATPYNLPDDPRLRYARILTMFIHRVDQGPADFHNPDAEKDHVCYPNFPSRAVIQLRDLLADMRASLPQVTAPALLIYSHQDKTVLPPNAEKVYSNLGSQQKEIFWVENSGHVIPREPDRYLAFKAIDDFITRITKTNQSP